MKIRINKYLSNSGVGSRRKVEELLWNKEIQINNKVAEPGEMIDTETDKIFYKGKIVSHTPKPLYIILNKPLNVVSTAKDERGRRTVLDLIRSTGSMNPNERLYPVGRLDRNSTGLILLTNDGDLALKLTHPRYHLPKIYEVVVQEKLTDANLKKLAEGVEITIEDKEVITMPANIKKLSPTSFEITLYQGMKRQIREMCASIGLSVVSLHRIAIGEVQLGSLKPGEFRQLNEKELSLLKDY